MDDPNLLIGDGFQIRCVEIRGEDWVYSDDVAEVTFGLGFRGRTPVIWIYRMTLPPDAPAPGPAWFLTLFQNIESKFPEAEFSWWGHTIGIPALQQLSAAGKITLGQHTEGIPAWYQVAVTGKGSSGPT